MTKKIFIVKKELPFPDFSLFKTLNKIWWRIVLTFFVLRLIKKNKDITVITDVESKSILQSKSKNKILLLDDFVKQSKFQPYYSKIKSMFKDWYTSKKLKEYLTYQGINLLEIVEREFIFNYLLKILNDIEVIKSVIKTKEPKELIVLDKNSVFGRSVSIIYGGEISSIFPKTISNSIYWSNKFFKKYSLLIRFYSLPLIQRREFVSTKRIPKRNEKEKVLCYISSEDHLSRINSVVQMIKKKGEQDILSLTTYKKTQKKLKTEGTDCVTFGNYLNNEISKKIEIKKKLLEKKWKRIVSDKAIRDIFKYEGLDLFYILKDDLQNLFTTQFAWLLYYIETVQLMIERENLSCIMVIDDALIIERILVILGKSKKIPTLRVQNGIEPAIMGFEPFITDKKAFWGETSKNFAIKHGVDPKKCVITGASKYDEIVTKKNQKKDEIYSRLKLDKNKEIILVATQAFDEAFAEKEKEMKLKCILSSMKKLPGKQLIIKPHPREKTDLHYSLVKKMGREKNIKIIESTNILDLISICNIFITTNSTTALEAIIFDKPVISLNLMKRTEIIPFVKRGLAYGVYKKEHLLPLLKKILKGRNIGEKIKAKNKRFIEEYCYKIDGKSSERIVRLIESMCQHTKK